MTWDGWLLAWFYVTCIILLLWTIFVHAGRDRTPTDEEVRAHDQYFAEVAEQQRQRRLNPGAFRRFVIKLHNSLNLLYKRR